MPVGLNCLTGPMTVASSPDANSVDCSIGAQHFCSNALMFMYLPKISQRFLCKSFRIRDIDVTSNPAQAIEHGCKICWRGEKNTTVDIAEAAFSSYNGQTVPCNLASLPKEMIKLAALLANNKFPRRPKSSGFSRAPGTWRPS